MVIVVEHVVHADVEGGLRVPLDVGRRIEVGRVLQRHAGLADERVPDHPRQDGRVAVVAVRVPVFIGRNGLGTRRVQRVDHVDVVFHALLEQLAPSPYAQAVVVPEHRVHHRVLDELHG